MLSQKNIIRYASHLLFWAGAIALLTLYYGRFTEQYTFSFWFVCLQMPIVMGTVYFINYWLVKRFLLPGRWFKFGLYFIYTLIVSIYLQLSVVLYTFVSLAGYQIERMNPISSDVVFLVFGTYFLVFIASSVKMLKHWLQSRTQITRLENERLAAELKLRETELKVLRGQIQPHFLFNTLNNLYGLALEKADRLPQAILQLSDILDFLLYRTDKETIPLGDELKLIENYIRLEQLRFEERLQYASRIEGELDEVALPPFAIFTFVENAFKHGFAEDAGLVRLELSICHRDKTLAIEVRNSLPAKANTEKPGGIGLPNLRRRLEHVFDQFKMDRSVQEGDYVATLEIDLKSLKSEAAPL